jgi:transglutaminase-like putative cysteine protease
LKLAFLVLLLFALSALPAAAAVPSLIVQRLQVDIVVGRDGRASLTTRREQTPMDVATAARIGRFAIGLDAGESLGILQAAIQKRDGSRVDLDPSTIRTRMAPGVPDIPPFQDVRQQIITFPALGVGDTEVIAYRRQIEHPLIAGQFFWAMAFSDRADWRDATITITAPADYPLHTESFGLAFSRSVQAGLVRTVWRFQADGASAEDTGVLSRWDRLPRLFVSSLPDYAALAAAYAAMAAPMQAVTPPIQARADAITAGLAAPRLQAQALYDWVALHIHCVPLGLAADGLQPQAAASVLARGIGDSKDLAVLLAALLRAKGIDSRTVLLNLDTAYTLSGPPTLAQLDHALLWLPAFDLYADASSGVAPFGTLPFQAYGKPAVVVGGDGDVPRRMPDLAPDAASIATTTLAHMDLDGAMLGTTSTVATGPAAIALRLETQVSRITGAEAATRVLARAGEQGGGAFQLSPTDISGASFTVGGRFRLESRPGILDGDSFAPPLGLPLLVRPGDFFLGPLHDPDLADNAPTPCYPGRQTEDLSLQLPQGRQPRSLPRDLIIVSAAFSYRSHWEIQGQTLRVHREMISRIATPLCSGALRQAVVAAQAAIRRDEAATIALAGP